MSTKREIIETANHLIDLLESCDFLPEFIEGVIDSVINGTQIEIPEDTK